MLRFSCASSVSDVEKIYCMQMNKVAHSPGEWYCSLSVTPLPLRPYFVRSLHVAFVRQIDTHRAQHETRG